MTRVKILGFDVNGTLVGKVDEFYAVDSDVPVAHELAVKEKHNTPMTKQERAYLEKRKITRLPLTEDEFEVIEE